VTLVAADIKARIEAANVKALASLTSGEPVLVDIGPAGEVVRGLEDRMILHAGPPIGWDRMCGALRGSAIGLAIFEGWATDAQQAERLLGHGDIRMEPNHAHGGVGPMAGTTSRSLPVFVVEDRAHGTRAYCRPAEDRQQFGDYSQMAIGTLIAWRDVFGPSLRQAIRLSGGIPLRPIMAKALQMGDDLHNRPIAASSIFANQIAPWLVEAGTARESLVATLRLLAGHELLFLSLSMAAAKAVADAAHGVATSTLVTAMARNGTEFGIRVSGLGDRWFTAPAPAIEALYLPGYGAADAGLDMGDSAITETVGLGAFTLPGALAILALIGGTPEQAATYGREMREITAGTHTAYRMPSAGFAGSPVGIDIRKVVRTGITPIIDTAVAHREPGHPIIGSGLVRAPLACFVSALEAFGRAYDIG
jgi:Protein of unknown function (DUF1116)